MFKRYASPFLCIDQFIELGKFSKFMSMLYEKENEEKLWQFFLYKVENKSFDEFKAECTPRQMQVVPVDMKTIVGQSMQILKGVSGNGDKCI